MPVVNIDELNEIMGNDAELIQECFADFLVEYPGMIKAIKTAIETEQFVEIDNNAHKIKGSLKYLAADAAANAAYTIEKAGQSQDLEGIDEKLAMLEAECQKVILFIDECPF
ncbi:MAG: Hpt domain-containing protein [Desulfobacter sp.]|nr:MAG: Hpt domain-containing protein [Desulfobacter sp.]